jgi:hypothetical protein
MPYSAEAQRRFKRILKDAEISLGEATRASDLNEFGNAERDLKYFEEKVLDKISDVRLKEKFFWLKEKLEASPLKTLPKPEIKDLTREEMPEEPKKTFREWFYAQLKPRVKLVPTKGQAFYRSWENGSKGLPMAFKPRYDAFFGVGGKPAFTIKFNAGTEVFREGSKEFRNVMSTSLPDLKLEAREVRTLLSRLHSMIQPRLRQRERVRP